MHVLLDNLSAAVIGAMIMLMLVRFNTQNGQNLVETAAYYQLSTQTDAFGDILRRDLQGIEEVYTVDGSSGEFRFKGHIAEEATASVITYKVVKETSARGLLIERYVDGVLQGGSSDIIAEWNIVALNQQAGAITDPDDAAQILVQFETVPPVGEEGVVEGLIWEASFHPPLRN